MTADDENDDRDNTQRSDEMAHSSPPSHILQDGRFIHLPPPTDAERREFLERSIARYGLLRSDLAVDNEEEKESTEEDKKERKSKKIHPLAVASARLNANGIAELSKAINLSGLVSSGEYFGLSNIVDPSLEIPTPIAAATAEPQKASEQAATSPGETPAATPSAAAASAPTSSLPTADEAHDIRLRSAYIGKRKRAQFVAATKFLEQHERRLTLSHVAQSVMDRRLRSLRKRWRLVAPEHGTRARPHAVRSTEVVAMDVHVYDRDRTEGGSTGIIGDSTSLVGRIARRVPRYATVELQDDYDVTQDLAEWKKRYATIGEQAESSGSSEMDIDKTADDMEEHDKDEGNKTRAEPFAVADPTLGKIDVDFDPEKVPMLTLQLSIEKASTGFHESACLSPLIEADAAQGDDEKVVVALQHSLFCASLFESIRRELAPDDLTTNGEAGRSHTNKSAQQPTVWLSSEAEENFLPPPSLMAGGGDDSEGVPSLCVVHCHEGEAKVQLDSEYALTVKLVEAGTAAESGDSKEIDDEVVAKSSPKNGNHNRTNSGSQSPAQLKALCRALLLHIQDVYHTHSIKARSMARARQQREKDTAAPGLARVKKQTKAESPHLLQNCVSLGAKMLFERRVRWALKRVAKWLKQNMHTNDQLEVEWLSLSVFDLHSKFVLCFRDDFCVDVSIDRDCMNVTSFGADGEGFQSVEFHSDVEFELFLKLELRKRLTGAD